MKLTKAVNILEKRYKPIVEWPNDDCVPDDLPEDAEIKTAWQTVIDSRKKAQSECKRQRLTKEKYNRLVARKKEIKADVAAGFTLKALSEKYGPRDMINWLKKIRLYKFYRTIKVLRSAWYAYDGQNSMIFKDVDQAMKYTNRDKKTKFHRDFRRKKMQYNGYTFYTYEEFIQINPDYQKVFDDFFKKVRYNSCNLHI